MSEVIYKYPISGSHVDLPVGAKLLNLQVQRDKVVLWAEVDPAARSLRRLLASVWTGSPPPTFPVYWDRTIHAPGQYLGTVQSQSGAIVDHYYIQSEQHAKMAD